MRPNEPPTKADQRWTVGAGFEYGFLPNWSAALQYGHYDFGDKNVLFAAPLAPNHRISQTVEMITARINWRLGWNNPY